MRDIQDIITWQEDGTPFSEVFSDIYFSKAQGFDEKSHVFINGNNLPERFKTAGNFTIIEAGFGTGLNFLLTLKHWQELAPKDAVLKYIGFEQYPMSQIQIIKSLEKWRGELPQFDQFIECYSTLKVADKVFNCNINNCSLRLHLGDINSSILLLNDQADAWFLDGFSPAKNPQMWSDKLLAQMPRLTKAGGSFATYSAAGWLREKLRQQGFLVQKAKGFANKKAMNKGVFQSE